ncbi:MAG TPA: tetratricopeptide repeat protein, partial [Planctomycetota bacterium]|nr:tetratricopeptide repeat protein [Planctomycetota bacterium]
MIAAFSAFVALLWLQSGAPPASSPASQPAVDAAQQRATAAELMRQGRKAEAIAALQAAFAADESLESAIALMRACIADERYNDALRALDGAAVKHSKEVALHVAFGEAFAARAAARKAQGADTVTVAAEYESAARALEDAIALSPKDPALFAACLRYFLFANMPEDAADAAKKAREAGAASSELSLFEGDAHFHLGLAVKPSEEGDAKSLRDAELASAKASYESAAKLAPQAAEPHARLGSLLLAMGAPAADARVEYRKALALDPTRVDVGPAIGKMTPKEMLDFFTAALADFRAANPKDASTSPRSAPIHWYLGYAHLNGGDSKSAAAEFGQAAKLNPDDTSARYYLGKIAYNDKRFDDALRELDGIAKRSPKELGALARTDSFGVPMLQYLIGKAVGAENGATSVGGGGLETAVRLERAILEVSPDSIDDWNNLALFLRDGGHAKESLEAYRKALDMNPTDPRLMNDTAVVYHYYLKSNDAEAKELYERAIATAKAILADAKANPSAKENAKGALTDAETNLERLKAGNRR